MDGRSQVISGKIAEETLRRYPGCSLRSLAKFLVARYGETFKNDVEYARTKLRYYAGSKGDEDRRNVRNSGRLVERVTLPKTKSIVRKPYRLSPGRWGILADVHIPFHDETALVTAVDYLVKAKVDGILLNGDFQDAESLSYWRPTRKRDFNEEVDQVIDALDWLRGEFKGKKIVYKPGNHEDRLKDYYWVHAPQLAENPIVAMETVLGLEYRGIEYLESAQIVMAGKLPIIHGNEVRGGSKAVNPARWLYLKWQGIAMCSHSHQSSQHDSTTGKGDLLTCWSTGCLCSLTPDYNPYANNWTHGFAIVNVEKDGEFEVFNHRIWKGKVV